MMHRMLTKYVLMQAFSGGVILCLDIAVCCAMC